MNPETDAAIAKAWPGRWAKAQTKRGGRNKVRKAWKDATHLESLREREASCANCKHREGDKCGMVCTGGWTMTVKPNDLCADWAKITARAKPKE